MPSRLPNHIGFIPDGNRRWATARHMRREAGYAHGIAPGLTLLDQCNALGIPEVSIYGFTVDNTKRPSVQREAFCKACVEFANGALERGAAVLVLGNTDSRQFPSELRQFSVRQGSGIRVNLLCNYGWEWDLDGLRSGALRSSAVPRLDLIVRWGGGRRLSGFLPVQSVYADFYVVDDYWPDCLPAHLEDALQWYSRQDRTLGG